MRFRSFPVWLATLTLSAGTAYAQTNLVQNGNFAQTSYTANNQFGSAWSQTTMQGVTDWTGDGGYNIFFFNGTATTVSAVNQWGSTAEKLYATSSTVLNPAKGFSGSSPTGDNFIMMDGDQTPGIEGAISQTISGLTVGRGYSVSFTWSGAQLQSRSGNTTEQLLVSLGTSSFITARENNPSGDFYGWVTQSVYFLANAASETLSFMAVGTPVGLPPVVVLTDISMVSVPEPGTMAVLGVGIAGLIASRRRRR